MILCIESFQVLALEADKTLEIRNYSLLFGLILVQDCYMRKIFEVQLALGAVPIEQVKIPTRTRDELPPTLAALQWMLTTPEVSAKVFKLLVAGIWPRRMAQAGKLAKQHQRACAQLCPSLPWRGPQQSHHQATV